MDVPPYSARGLKQSLDPVGQSISLERTVNGELIDTSVALFRKYRSTIQGADQQPPAVDGVWPGLTVTVGCTVELCYKTAGGTPARPVVDGSSRVEGAFTFYRPSLEMKITMFSVARDEYGDQVSWQMDLEEV
jgi:hypothetical protein